MVPEVFTVPEALGLLAHGYEEAAVGPFIDRAVVAVDLDAPHRPEDLDHLAAILRHRPCVSVGLASCPDPERPPPDLDVLLSGGVRCARPWVATIGELDVALDELADAVDASPAAAVALVQLLRAGEALDVVDAVTAESWVYGLLQAGPDHRRWLARRVWTDAHADGDGPVVRVERDGDRLDVVIDRPHVRNAYSARVRDELVAALQLVAADPTIAEVHVSGAGPSFCAGGDLDEFGTVADPVTAHLIRTTRNAGPWLARLADRVTVHAHGASVGAGVELAAFTGRVEATADATFLLPEIAMGLVPGAGGTASIPRRIGRQRAAWLALTGTRLDARTAHDWGLVDHTVPLGAGSGR